MEQKAEGLFRKELEETHGERMSPDALLASIGRISVECGLGISPVYLQGIKTSLSMSGNVMAFQGAKLDAHLRQTAGRVVGTVVRDQFLTHSPHTLVTRWRKKHRVAELNR